MSALNGRCRPLRLFRAGILGVHVTMARALLVLHDPFRVGAWVIPRGRECVFLPGACAPGCPARPFQGRNVGDSPGARMRVSSRGLRPGLSCATLSGSSAHSKRASARYAGKIYDDRHGSGAAADCQTSAPHQAFTGNNHAAHSQSLTCGQQPARSGANPRYNRYRNRYRDRYRCGGAADINKAAFHSARISIAAAIAMPVPIVIPWQGAAYCRPHQTPERQRLSGSHGHEPWFQVGIRDQRAL